MPPLCDSDAWDAYEGIETVDLTLSPSPEPQQPRLLQQRRPPQYFKTDSDAESSNMVGVKTGNPAKPLPQDATYGTPPRIHPKQLRKIVETSSPKAVRDVLLNLCDLSPALSGAVARGLASNSTYAQETIRDYQQKIRSTKAEPDPMLVHSSSFKRESHAQLPGAWPSAASESAPSPITVDDNSDSTLDDENPVAKPSIRRVSLSKSSSPCSSKPHRVSISQPSSIPLHQPQPSREAARKFSSASVAKFDKFLGKGNRGKEPVRDKQEPVDLGQSAKRPQSFFDNSPSRPSKSPRLL